jgi:hypothetical protein
MSYRTCRTSGVHKGMPLEEVRATMRQIWEPNAIWQKVIDEALARGQSQQRREANS